MTDHAPTSASTEGRPVAAGEAVAHRTGLHDHGRHHRHVEVVVVGGGPAGLAAALTLGRSRRDVLVVDDGEPRNAPAAAMHAFLTRDGTPPGELLELGREEVARYGVVVEAGRVTEVERAGRRFRVGLADGGVVLARRLVVTTGLVDELPDVEGLADHWGGDVVHCPYCHGWEVRDRSIGVLATSVAGAHQAGLFRQLSDDVVLLTHTGPPLDDDAAAGLAARGVEVVDGEVERVESSEGALTGVTLADGRTIPLGALAVAPRFVARASLLVDLGLEAVEHPSGLGLHVPAEDPTGRSAVDGVWLAGNVTDPMAQVITAASQGNNAGAAVNMDLVQEDTDRALAASEQPEGSDEWDDHYTVGGDASMWSGEPNGALVAEVSDLEPGTALDVGCGEGADAVWLAQRGWQVTGIDPSRVALDRAGTAALEAGVDVDLVHAGLVEHHTTGATYDLVSAQYPAVRRRADSASIRAMLDAVAPGGTLLLVHHEVDNEHAEAHGFDPEDYVQPDHVAAHVASDPDWEVEAHERRDRPGGREHHPVDVVLRARRRPS